MSSRNAARARSSPAIYVVNSSGLGEKDPDEFVREGGIRAWCKLIGDRECGIVWRAKEMVRDLARDAPQAQRREALRRTGAWLGALPPRLALAQEDAVQIAAKRCGYSPEAAARAFRESFLPDVTSVGNGPPARESLERRTESGVEL